MCGRYYVDDETAREIQKIISDLDKRLNPASIRPGEIFPTNEAAILAGDGERIKPYLCKWGFPNSRNKGVIINARSETAFERKMFQESLLFRRCVIPASGFFEWNKCKEKIYFTPKDSSENIMYMAGLYNSFNKETRFVILTTAANSSISDIHERMPLLLSAVDLKSWILDNTSTQNILNRTPYLVNRTSDFEQLKLDLT